VQWQDGDTCIYQGKIYVVARVLQERGEALLKAADGELHFGVPLTELRKVDEA
jgi:hypothetical protein